MKLSVAVITFNEEKNLDRCLTSVADLADEIVVVDSFSQDKTEAIARAHNATFIQNPFEGHIQQKNFALTQVKGPLVLSLDADEALSDDLKVAIREIKKNPSATAYTMNRMTNYCGQWIKHCGWYPDKKLRLFQKGFAHWGGLNPHDKIVMENTNDQPVHIQGDILHYSFYTVDEHRKQIDSFSTIGAKAYLQQGKKAYLPKVLLAGPICFIRDYFLHLGILDGRKGFTICRLNAKHAYLKYKKLYTLQREGQS